MFLLGKLFEFSVEQRVTGWNLTTGDVGTGWDDRQPTSGTPRPRRESTNTSRADTVRWGE